MITTDTRDNTIFAPAKYEYTDFDQIGPNTNFHFTKRNIDEMLWQELYDGYLDSLFPVNTKTKENGLLFTDKTWREDDNWFYKSSRIYQGGVIGQRPVVAGSEQVKAFMKSKDALNFWREVEEAERHHSIKRRFIMVVYNDGSYAAVDPANCILIYDPMDRRRVIGYVFTYTWHEFDANEEKNPAQSETPNRIRLAQFSDVPGYEEYNRYYVCELGGRRIGEVLDSGDSGIKAVLLVGNGDSYYPDLIPKVRALIIRETVDTYILNAHGEPEKITPPRYQQPQTDAEGRLLPVENRDIISTMDQKATYGYLEYSGNLTASENKIRRLHQGISVTTSVPPMLLGVDLGLGESGVAREYNLFALQVTIRQHRNQLQIGMEFLLRAILGDDVEVEVQWPEQTFASFERRLDSMVTMLDSDLVDHEYAQIGLDVPVKDIRAASETEQPEMDDEEVGRGLINRFMNRGN